MAIMDLLNEMYSSGSSKNSRRSPKRLIRSWAGRPSSIASNTSIFKIRARKDQFYRSQRKFSRHSPQYSPLPTRFVSLLTSNHFSTPARKLFNSKGFSDNLYFSHKLVHTGKIGKSSLNHTYLKPAQYFMVINENKELRAVALSDEEAAFFKEQLTLGQQWLAQHNQSKAAVKRQIALFSADGFMESTALKSLPFLKINCHTCTT